MKVTGKNGADWVLDDGLRKLALELVNAYPDELGHINVAHVVFVRTSQQTAKWYGKTWYVNTPHSIIPWYTYGELKKNHVIVEDFEADAGRTNLLEDLVTVTYIIALNDAAFERFDIDGADGLRQKQERNVLVHELKHIKPDMDGIQKHDVEDFSDLLRRFGIDWSQGIYDNGEEVEHS